MKTRTGYTYKDKRTGFWYARLTYTDDHGKRRDIKKRGDSKADANAVIKKLINTLDAGGHGAIQAEKLTFDHLCDYYAEHYMIPAQYANGRKLQTLPR